MSTENDFLNIVRAQEARGKKDDGQLNEDGHWIQSAIKHKGALHADLGVPAGEKIPKSKIKAAAKRDDVTGKRARLALTLGKMHKK